MLLQCGGVHTSSIVGISKIYASKLDTYSSVGSGVFQNPEWWASGSYPADYFCLIVPGFLFVFLMRPPLTRVLSRKGDSGMVPSCRTARQFGDFFLIWWA